SECAQQYEKEVEAAKAQSGSKLITADNWLVPDERLEIELSPGRKVASISAVFNGAGGVAKAVLFLDGKPCREVHCSQNISWPVNREISTAWIEIRCDVTQICKVSVKYLE
ncbi:MAG: hypothetical protein PHW04_18415, partial [Candidatus Wallbacteria bacterium]|nr:hypothetical protein [Candidatus Wallbacteria bacterium]